ncbi:MAG: hypothetical protein U0325_36410, partial [Polyangiales bacterium]
MALVDLTARNVSARVDSAVVSGAIDGGREDRAWATAATSQTERRDGARATALVPFAATSEAGERQSTTKTTSVAGFLMANRGGAARGGADDGAAADRRSGNVSAGRHVSFHLLRRSESVGPTLRAVCQVDLALE